MKKQKNLDLFNENKLQDLAIIKGGTTPETGSDIGEALSAAEMATVVFEEEGASFTKPFGRTHFIDGDGTLHKDYVVFGIVVCLNRRFDC